MEFSVEWWGRKHLKELDYDCFIYHSSKKKKSEQWITLTRLRLSPRRQEDGESLIHGLNATSTTIAILLTFLAATAVSGKPNRKNLDVHFAAALW